MYELKVRKLRSMGESFMLRMSFMSNNSLGSCIIDHDSITFSLRFALRSRTQTNFYWLS